MARQKAYGKSPTVVIFKSSNRSNARVKMKVFRTRTIDQVLDIDEYLPGVKGEILEISVGEKAINILKQKYRL
jgi:hypothetical protein